MHVRTVLLALIALSLVADQAAAARTTPTVVAGPSTYRVVLFDGHGNALYAFTRDPPGRSTCSGACAAAWPPYVVSGRVRPGVGIRGGLVGTATRDGRRQLTYAGRPLYFYIGDRKPGQILCQNVVEFGGRWLVVRPSGGLVR